MLFLSLHLFVFIPRACIYFWVCIYLLLDLGQSSQDHAPSDFSRVIGRFNDIGMAANYLRGLDDATQEEFENPTPDWTIREHVSKIIKLYFEQQLVNYTSSNPTSIDKTKKIEMCHKFVGF